MACAIHLDSDTIVFRGNADDSAGQVLSGFIVFRLQAPRYIEDIYLRVLVILNISNKALPLRHRLRQFFRCTKARSIETVLELLWPQDGGLQFPAGDYKYPFESCLPSDLVESIQGIPEISLKYRVDALIADKGTPIFYACKDLCIIRTPAVDALDPLQSASGEGIWNDKLKYSVDIFPKAVSFGSTIQVDLFAYPLTSGIALGDVVARVVEFREFSIVDRLEPGPQARKYIAKNSTVQRDIALDSVGKGWMFTVPIPLPRKLGDCVQNLEYNEIRVCHEVEVVMPVKEMAGPEFEFRAIVPIRVYMPLNAVFSTKGTLLTITNPTGINEPASSVAPPMYNKQDQEPPEYTLAA